MKPGTHWISINFELADDLTDRWRLVESDTRQLVMKWLPTDPLEDDGPVDGGGWMPRQFPDAIGFGLAILWYRAAAGYLDGITTADIDERRHRNMVSPGRPPRPGTRPI